MSRRDELPRSVASLLAGLLLLAVTLGYGSGSYAPYYAFRVAFLYPVATLLISAAVWSIARPGTRVYLDWYDVLVLLFCLWQVVCAALSPVPVLAWFGVYNRIGGAVSGSGSPSSAQALDGFWAVVVAGVGWRSSYPSSSS